MKEIYQAFRGAGVAEMEAIKVTDSFNDIINRLDSSQARFEKESAVNRVIMGLTLTSVIGLTIALFTGVVAV
jgi:hypothetical protein